MDTIYFYLPDFYDKYDLNMLLCDLMRLYPEYFYDDIKIGAVYGSFPNAIWNGGRVMLGGATKEEMDYVIHEFNKRGIAIRYTFTNPLIKEQHLNDTFCNLCLKEADHSINEVIVNSSYLEAYIRKNYPEYKLISSTTKCLAATEQIEKEIKKDYSLIVLDNSFINDEKLWALPHKERYEILINSYCKDSCPDRLKHYEEIGRAQLEFRSSNFKECPYLKLPREEQMKKRGFITKELLYGKYRKAGFRHFKIDGRAFKHRKVADSYLYYLVKPEYHDEVNAAFTKVLEVMEED